MRFPVIHHIDDVINHIQDKDEFKLRDKGNYKTIDYVYQDEDTFSNNVLLECRGIKFGEYGEIICRLPQKCFNAGERKDLEEIHRVNFSHYEEKLDGSLVHPMIIEGCLRFATKAGITDVSQQCWRELVHTDRLSAAALDAMRQDLMKGVTPCFEYISPNNRIVIRYDEPELVYLCSRDNHTGEYIDQKKRYADCGIRSAYNYGNALSTQEILSWEDREGVVAVYHSGYREKIKAEAYVLKHKTKDDVRYEKNLIQLIINDDIDDLYSILDQEDINYVLDYKDRFMQARRRVLEQIVETLKDFVPYDRKHIALNLNKHISKQMIPLFWKIYDGHDPVEVYNNFVLKKTGSQGKLDTIRELLPNESVILFPDDILY